MRTLFAEYTVMAEKKIENVMQEPLVSETFSKFVMMVPIRM